MKINLKNLRQAHVLGDFLLFRFAVLFRYCSVGLLILNNLHNSAQKHPTR